jgi:predicted nucleic acid-binding protein
MMILYLDTSALVKNYVDESGSDIVRAMIAQAEMVASHQIAYVEAQAAFARLHREQMFTTAELEIVTNEFEEDWTNYFQVPVPQPLLRRAAELARIFALRAYDSVHLAAVEMLVNQTEQPVIFACFDQRLNRAANQLGLQLLISI